MHKYTDFGTEVRVGLARKGMSTTELCHVASELSGRYIDRSYLSRICRGMVKKSPLIPVIKEILDIKEVG